MHALSIRKPQAEALKKLLERAAREPVMQAQWKMRRQLVAMGMGYEMPDAACVSIPVGYEVAFEHIETAQGVMARHLAVHGPNQLPHAAAVQILMKLLGFRLPVEKCIVFTTPRSADDVPPDRQVMAVHVVEPLDGDMRALRRGLDKPAFDA